MDQNMQIKAVRDEKDAQIVARLARTIWEEHYTPIIGAMQVHYMLGKFQSPEAIRSDVAEKGYAYLWIETSGKPVAYMAYRIDLEEGGCFLSKFYVHKAFRGQKIGRLMMQELQKRCRDANLSHIWLTVNKNNWNSIQAYKKMMFYQIDSVVTDIGNGYVMDDYVMRKDLDPINL
jgi:diamine N-acetyltransferase